MVVQRVGILLRDQLGADLLEHQRIFELPVQPPLAVAGQEAADVVRELSRHRVPMKAAPIIAGHKDADARRIRSADLEHRLHELLQQVARTAPKLVGERQKRLVLGLAVRRARGAALQLLGREYVVERL